MSPTTTKCNQCGEMENKEIFFCSESSKENSSPSADFKKQSPSTWWWISKIYQEWRLKSDFIVYNIKLWVYLKDWIFINLYYRQIFISLFKRKFSFKKNCTSFIKKKMFIKKILFQLILFKENLYKLFGKITFAKLFTKVL